jgi:hypothetical protein
MKRNTSVIWSWLFAASIVGLVSVLNLAAIHIWGENEPGTALENLAEFLFRATAR